MIVDWSTVGNFCHILILVAEVSCMALVDSSSNATLVRPDRLKTVTGDFAPIKGKGLFLFDIGGLSLLFHVRVAEVQDPCILGLDFLNGCWLCVGSM